MKEYQKKTELVLRSPNYTNLVLNILKTVTLVVTPVTSIFQISMYISYILPQQGYHKIYSHYVRLNSKPAIDLLLEDISKRGSGVISKNPSTIPYSPFDYSTTFQEMFFLFSSLTRMPVYVHQMEITQNKLVK